MAERSSAQVDQRCKDTVAGRDRQETPTVTSLIAASSQSPAVTVTRDQNQPGSRSPRPDIDSSLLYPPQGLDQEMNNRRKKTDDELKNAILALF